MAIKEHGAVRLVWNKTDEDEWQAGGLTRHFTISINGIGSYTMYARTGDNPPLRVGVFSSLQQAQFRAQRILDQSR